MFLRDWVKLTPSAALLEFPRLTEVNSSISHTGNRGRVRVRRSREKTIERTGHQRAASRKRYHPAHGCDAENQAAFRRKQRAVGRCCGRASGIRTKTYLAKP